MIREIEAISSIEALEHLDKDEENEKNLAAFIKKFNKLTVKEAKQLRKSIEELNSMKIKKEHISKIIDLLPENNQDLNKIFVDINLDEDETKNILDRVKEFK